MKQVSFGTLATFFLLFNCLVIGKENTPEAHQSFLMDKDGTNYVFYDYQQD